ncbi:rho GTPase-activating protein 18 isoform X1 [Neophocaena asiaeorientalis asiaeorientalis]|uniref:Rho GTPase-activating protein 18 n=1 Tax=Neophocaena asiaeorientalis asiaeorientalis TaxID=1706337 RepID=A0A341CK37_NEOAA|nr:rho GTPase-activating protein 18 isoform X1 [Neophocaena asiaeorientalis asiaeorientalis]
MSWLSSSQGVVLTAYHPSGKDQALGGNHGKGGEEATTSRRYGQYTMNQEITKVIERPSFDRSSSQDSLDELSMEDYWTELENIKKSSENRQENQEVVVVKEPDEGELEEEWLKEAGLSNLFGEAAGDPQESMVFLSTLTRTQAAAVQKRVETVSQTLRKKNKQYQVPDVRDIFAQQRGSKEREPPDGAESQSVRTDENKYQGKDDQASSLVVGGKELTPLVPEEAPASETDINLEVSFAEQAVNQKESSREKIQRSKGDDALLPSFRLPKDKTGTTKIGDLAPQDMKKVCHLALIELTALYDVLGVELKQLKAVKIKTKDSGLFGVPLTVLLEQDQKKVPGTRIPLIFQKLISRIEEGGLETEGLLRIPGAAVRIKNLCQELEAKFYEGTFNWESVKQHDAASLLKLFIRELPQPLLSVEYLKAFQAVQNLPTRKQQLQALNLLVILLPDANRDTLKALLEFLQRVVDNKEKNKMTVMNVAMVMAPNLFMYHTLGLKSSEQREFVMAAGIANIMHLLIKYQKLLWTIPKFIVNQVRKQNTENHRKDKKAMKKLLKKMAYDREKYEKQDKSANDADVPQGVIRVQAPHLSKVSMAIQLTEELRAGDVLARFLSQESSGVAQTLKNGEVFLYEIGGNIGERCLDDDTYMKDLYQLNPNAEWVIKSKPS